MRRGPAQSQLLMLHTPSRPSAPPPGRCFGARSRQSWAARPVSRGRLWWTSGQPASGSGSAPAPAPAMRSLLPDALELGPDLGDVDQAGRVVAQRVDFDQHPHVSRLDEPGCGLRLHQGSAGGIKTCTKRIQFGLDLSQLPPASGPFGAPSGSQSPPVAAGWAPMVAVVAPLFGLLLAFVIVIAYRTSSMRTAIEPGIRLAVIYRQRQPGVPRAGERQRAPRRRNICARRGQP